MTNITERVERGATLLDKKRPGWEKEIDLDNLDMREPKCCIVGQLHEGQFAMGLSQLGLLPWTEDNEVSSGVFGFTTPRGVDEYAQLTASWKTLLAERARTH